MAISLSDAKGAVKAVNSFTAISGNATCHGDYHFFEAQARSRVAIGGPATVCGFYQTSKQVSVWTHNTSGQTSYRRPKKKRSKYTQSTETAKTSFKNSSPIERGKVLNGIIMNVLIPALNDHDNGEYKEDGVDPDNVFHYIYDLADGYGGTTVTRVGNEYNCTHIAVVIRKSGVNWRIASHYPVGVGGFQNMTDLI